MAKKTRKRKQTVTKTWTEAKLKRRLHALEQLTTVFDDGVDLVDDDREKIARILADIREGVSVLGDRKSLVIAYELVYPIIGNSMLSVDSEKDWWDRWWNKVKWLRQKYKECRKENKSKAKREACYWYYRFLALQCSGSDGPDKATAVWLPTEILDDFGLNLDHTENVFGMVPFTMADHAVGVLELNELIDTRSWLTVRKARLSKAKFFRREVESYNCPDALSQTLVDSIASSIGRSARARGEFLRDLVASNEQEVLDKAAIAISNMQKTAVVRFEGESFLVSAFERGNPEILAQVPAEGGMIDASEKDAMDEVLFWTELALELAIGLLTLLGVHFPGGKNKVAKWAGRLMTRVTGNRRLRAALLRWIRSQGSGTFTASNILELLCLFFEHDAIDKAFIQDFLEDMADMGHWAILKTLAKIGARGIPGAGTALIIADLSFLLVEVVTKLDRHGNIDVLG